MPDDLDKTQQDLQPRRSWYEPRRTSVGDDKQTITFSWSKVGSAIGAIVFVGGIVSSSVNAAIKVAQYQAQIDDHEQKLAAVLERQAQMHEDLVRLRATQELSERLQMRIAALEDATEAPRPQDAAARRYPRGYDLDREPVRESPATAGATNER